MPSDLRMPSFYHIVINQMVSAFAYLASMQIVHGDVKPDNILCNGPDNFYLSGFGHAHYENRGDRAGGTPGYMAREVV
jgi:serine/threonine protein kinase